ncbi:IS5 family transposase [Kingella negevensis]|uniref:IS5 family transposase n=2 Tax=Kingella negevensis TaxID=1522312 RepID=UPI00050A1363
MPRLMLNNKQWARLKAISLKQGIYDKENLRKTVEGILYHMRTGIPWRDLPKYFGKSRGY